VSEIIAVQPAEKKEQSNHRIHSIKICFIILVVCMQRLIMFDAIVEGSQSSVRITKDDLLVAVDLVIAVTCQNKGHAGKTLRGLDSALFPSENFLLRTFPGKGNDDIKVVSLNDAIKLIMVLGGKTAKATRSKFADIIQRYLAGDKTLIKEIKANKAMGKLKSYSKFASGVMKSIDIENERRAHEMPQSNYIYATKSAAFPGLIKI
jgi:hypothetical protein